jgi:hypothetical protein
LIGIGLGKKLISGIKQKKATYHFILFNDLLTIVDQILVADPGVVSTKVFSLTTFLFSLSLSRYHCLYPSILF